MTDTMVPWGPTGQLVYERTYSRVKPNGERETWPETVERVVDGNLALGDPRFELENERDDLIRYMTEFKVIPAGRHLWASGVKGRQYLFNCHVAGWDVDPAEHFRFTFLRLMEGGGVGANYTNDRLSSVLPPFQGEYRLHVVCDPEHPDYDKLAAAGVLSSEFSHEWPGAFAVEDSREGWADALTDLLWTHYDGGVHEDRVYDVSRVRGEGARLVTFGGRASGPLPLAVMLREVAEIMNRSELGDLSGLEAMEIDHAIAKCVVSGGNRRSARMAIMHWDDPQIGEFIRVKQDTGSHWTTNISVEVDDEFWRHVDTESVYGEDWSDRAKEVLHAISEGMLHNGEPGIWNSTLSNEGEPNPVIATNPCGEIPLTAWENCNLGHVNLAAFVNERNKVDYLGLHRAHQLMTRFLIRATYGDVTDGKQRVVLARNRRIGVGHLGVASFLAKQGIKYSDAPGSARFSNLLDEMVEVVDVAAARYSHDLRIPVPVKMTTVAPTGTIAKLPGVSEGIHPIFAKYFIRRVRFSDVDEDQRATVEEYRAKGYHVEPCQYAPATSVVAIPTVDPLMHDVAERYGDKRAEEIVQSAADVSMADMLAFQALYQERWADNAVSYTVNIDPAKYTSYNIASELRWWGKSLKGSTVFPELSFPQAPYERLTPEEFAAYGDRFDEQHVEDSFDENCASGACPVR